MSGDRIKHSRILLQNEDLLNYKGGIGISPYYLSRLAVAAQDLISKALNWLSKEH